MGVRIRARHRFQAEKPESGAEKCCQLGYDHAEAEVVESSPASRALKVWKPSTFWKRPLESFEARLAKKTSQQASHHDEAMCAAVAFMQWKIGDRLESPIKGSIKQHSLDQKKGVAFLRQ